MSISDSPAKTVQGVPSWDRKLVFSALIQRARRKLLVALARAPQTGAELRHVGRGNGNCSGDENFLTSTLKNLKVMVEAGIVVEQENSRDGRRTIYGLAPGLKVTAEGEQTLIDFGFCVVRLSADGD